MAQQLKTQVEGGLSEGEDSQTKLDQATLGISCTIFKVLFYERQDHITKQYAKQDLYS